MKRPSRSTRNIPLHNHFMQSKRSLRRSLVLREVNDLSNQMKAIKRDIDGSQINRARRTVKTPVKTLYTVSSATDSQTSSPPQLNCTMPVISNQPDFPDKPYPKAVYSSRNVIHSNNMMPVSSRKVSRLFQNPDIYSSTPDPELKDVKSSVNIMKNKDNRISIETPKLQNVNIKNLKNTSSSVISKDIITPISNFSSTTFYDQKSGVEQHSNYLKFDNISDSFISQTLFSKSNETQSSSVSTVTRPVSTQGLNINNNPVASHDHLVSSRLHGGLKPNNNVMQDTGILKQNASLHKQEPVYQNSVFDKNCSDAIMSNDSKKFLTQSPVFDLNVCCHRSDLDSNSSTLVDSSFVNSIYSSSTSLLIQGNAINKISDTNIPASHSGVTENTLMSSIKTPAKDDTKSFDASSVGNASSKVDIVDGSKSHRDKIVSWSDDSEGKCKSRDFKNYPLSYIKQLSSNSGYVNKCSNTDSLKPVFGKLASQNENSQHSSIPSAAGHLSNQMSSNNQLLELLSSLHDNYNGSENENLLDICAKSRPLISKESDVEKEVCKKDKPQAELLEKMLIRSELTDVQQTVSQLRTSLFALQKELDQSRADNHRLLMIITDKTSELIQRKQHYEQLLIECNLKVEQLKHDRDSLSQQLQLNESEKHILSISLTERDGEVSHLNDKIQTMKSYIDNLLKSLEQHEHNHNISSIRRSLNKIIKDDVPRDENSKSEETNLLSISQELSTPSSLTETNLARHNSHTPGTTSVLMTVNRNDENKDDITRNISNSSTDPTLDGSPMVQPSNKTESSVDRQVTARNLDSDRLQSTESQLLNRDINLDISQSNDHKVDKSQSVDTDLCNVNTQLTQTRLGNIGLQSVKSLTTAVSSLAPYDDEYFSKSLAVLDENILRVQESLKNSRSLHSN